MSRDQRIAVVVPCFDAEGTLSAALDSALDQAGVDVEVIVVDDGSTDGSQALARRYEPRVRVLTGPNRGVSAARNRGIAATDAPWMVFLDADDELVPGSLARRLEVARTAAAEVVITDWITARDDGSGSLKDDGRRGVDWPALDDDAELAIASHVWAPPAAILYSRGIVDRIGGFRGDLPIIQDARLLFDAAHHGARIARANHVGARYRVHAESLSRCDPGRFHADLLTNAASIGDLWQARGPLDEVRRRALRDMLDNAGRGLFRAAHPRYLEAVAAQRRLGLPLPLHTRIAVPMARLLGLDKARALLSLVGRA